MKEKKVIKYLLFDLDGTLFDTKEANFLSYKRALEDMGVKLHKKNYYSAFGLRFNEMIKEVAPDITQEEILMVRKNKAKYYMQNLGHIRPNNYLINFIKLMKAGHTTVLVTTASKKNATNILKYFHIENYFDLAIYGEDVINGKPDPECYLTAIRRLGARPEQCLIFEDSDVGLRAAKNSGANVMKVVFDE